MECEPVKVMDDGWSEWIHPLSPYFLQCGAGGPVLEIESEIVPWDENDKLNPGERKDAVIIFRAKPA